LLSAKASWHPSYRLWHSSCIGNSSATDLQLCVPQVSIRGLPSTLLRSCAPHYAFNKSVVFSQCSGTYAEREWFSALDTSLVAGETSRDQLRLIHTEAKSLAASRGSSLRGKRSLVASPYGQLTGAHRVGPPARERHTWTKGSGQVLPGRFIIAAVRGSVRARE
jgi:hypothetical protein